MQPKLERLVPTPAFHYVRPHGGALDFERIAIRRLDLGQLLEPDVGCQIGDLHGSVDTLVLPDLSPPSAEGLAGKVTAWLSEGGNEWYISEDIYQLGNEMQTAKLFKYGRSQAVRLPKEFRNLEAM